ncbi:MAG: ABC transporter ATP-binding protein [Thiotrichales bacterium]|nr:ABC transporter ATP-binding protein [Thiotrichales bacterium]
MPASMLVVSSLTKVVASPGGELRLLQDINFSVDAGERVAIVGASGAGKSTLLGLLAGLDTPTSGSVQLNGVNLFDLNEDQRARMRGDNMSFVFQSFQLLANLNALENVALPLEIKGDDQALSKAKERLDEVGLAERIHHYPSQLSGGEQQRVALARAFITEPKLLLADEPTGSLDHDTGVSVINLLTQLNETQGSTLIIVTHDEKIAEYCQRVITIEAGRIQGISGVTK